MERRQYIINGTSDIRDLIREEFVKNRPPAPESVEHVKRWTLVERIYFGITYDTEGLDEDSHNMLSLYNRADPQTKEALDNFLKHLCGFDMDLLQDDEVMAFYYEAKRDAPRDE